MKMRLLLTLMLAGLGACVASVEPGDAPSSDEPIAQADEALRFKPEVCGQNVCGKGTYCCNASCGICAPLGGACTQQVCDTQEITCGNNVCGAGEYCCNASCGTCAPLGGACTQQVCLPTQ